MCHVRTQEHGSSVPGQQILPGSSVLYTFLDRHIGRRNVHNSMAQRHRHVHNALFAQIGPAIGQDVQPIHYTRVDYLPHCRTQRTCL